MRKHVTLILVSTAVAAVLIIRSASVVFGAGGDPAFMRAYQEVTMARCAPIIRYCGDNMFDRGLPLPDDMQFNLSNMCDSAKTGMLALAEHDPKAPGRIAVEGRKVIAEYERLPEHQRMFRLQACRSFLLGGH